MRSLPSLLTVLVLAACAGPPAPPPGTEVRAELVRMLTEADLTRSETDATGLLAGYLSPDQRERTEATNLPLYASEGRLALTRCTLGDFALYFPMAVMPTGTTPEPGELLRVRLGDATTPDQVLGIVMEPSDLARGTLRRPADINPPAVPPIPQATKSDPMVEAQYYRVTGGWLIRCVAPPG
jgi:hypothetical protein